MNLTDLREELATHADQLGSAPDFRAGVAARVRQTKRRRAAVTGAGAALAVAALAVGVVTSVGRPAPPLPAGTPSGAVATTGADGMPLRTVPDAPGDIVRDGLRYRARVGDDRLLAGAIGAPGQHTVTTSFRATDDRVSFSVECGLPGADPAQADRTVAWLVVDGKRKFGSTCGTTPATGDLQPGTAAPAGGLGWEDLSIGVPVTLGVEAVDRDTNRPATGASLRVAVAAYTMGPRSAVQDSAGKTVLDLPEVIEHQGYRYLLRGTVSDRLDSDRLPSVPAPAGPSIVTWGSSVPALLTPVPQTMGHLRLEGLPVEPPSRQPGTWGDSPVPAGSTQGLALVADGRLPASGTAFLAVYELNP